MIIVKFLDLCDIIRIIRHIKDAAETKKSRTAETKKSRTADTKKRRAAIAAIMESHVVHSRANIANI